MLKLLAQGETDVDVLVVKRGGSYARTMPPCEKP